MEEVTIAPAEIDGIRIINEMTIGEMVVGLLLLLILTYLVTTKIISIIWKD